MFDLPINPDLLEQRIGRLDRIGQLHTVNIHVPYYQQTPQQILLDWYHQGLNAFEQTCAIGHGIFEQVEDSLMQCLATQDEVEVSSLIDNTAAMANKLREQLQQGRDRLLELNSCRPKVAEAIVDNMLAAEKRHELEDFVERCCDQFGIDIEAHSQHAVIIRPGDHMKTGGFDLGEEGFTATFSRQQALSREDMHYLSWEHPFVQRAFDQVLYSEHGNTAVATVKLKPLKEGTLLLETLFSVEAIAPKGMALSRYLPARLIRVLVNVDGKDFAELLPNEKLTPLLQRIPLATAQALVKQGQPVIEQLLQKAEQQGANKLPAIIADAKALMQQELGAELHRLQALAKTNAAISVTDINQLAEQQAVLANVLDQAQINLDAMRVIMAV
jgi:ATP-dependent helicase HepA